MKKRGLMIGLALMVMPLAGCGPEAKTDIKVDSISLSESSMNMVVNSSATLTATVSPDNATDKTVTWSVAPSGVVTVDGGAVTAIAAGECVITAKAGDKEAQCNVTVTSSAVPVESITLNKSEIEVEVGATYQLTATVLPATATDNKVTWRSSNETYATVNANGLVSAKKITESPISITASAGGKEVSCSVTVKDIEPNKKYLISEVNQNVNITEYQNNTKDGGDYLGAIDKIQVGTDNGFNMKPQLVVYDKEEYQPVDSSVWTYAYEYKIEEFKDGAYVAAETTYADFDSTNAVFKFNSNAIGKTLRLSVTPGGLSAEEKAETRFTKTIEVDVAEGWNVYSAKELAYFDDPRPLNRWENGHGLTQDQQAAACSEFRSQNNLNPSYVAKNIFLQTNLKITAADIPSAYFYHEGQEGPAGKLIDGLDIYFRTNVDTIFNGNYFNIDTTEVPQAYVNPDPNVWDQVSHTSLFKVVETRTGVTGNQIFKNCSYFGNGRRSSDDTPKGGLIFLKFHSIGDVNQSNVKFSNYNIEAATISLFIEGNAAVTVDSCKVEQGFSNFMYIYERGDVRIRNSQIKDFGGPAIIGDPNKEHEMEYSPNIIIDNDSVVESWCVGGEPWFVANYAVDAATMIKGLNDFYVKTGLSSKTFLRANSSDSSKTEFNCIYVSRADDGSVFGSVTFGDKKMGVDKNSDPTQIGIYNGFSSSMPVLSTDAGGLALVYQHAATGGQQILTDTFDPVKLATGEGFRNLLGPDGVGHPIFSGNYLHLAWNIAPFGGITFLTQLFDQAA